ncbi:MAG: LysM peptidoglycan-binding domain-containing M23 family metallopeptidase [Chloroflexota bacterium]
MAIATAALACAPAVPAITATWTLVPPWTGVGPAPTATSTGTPTLSPLLRLFPPTHRPDQPALTPTPDPTRLAPPLRTESVVYAVRPGDSLNTIAQRYAVGARLIIAANNLTNPNLLYIGQVLLIPPPVPQPPGPSFKIIADSELVNGPSGALLDVEGFARQWGGYLSSYTEEVEGRVLTGPQVLQTVAQRYSVNPRLLLALLEHQSGWVTQADVLSDTLIYPMGFVGVGYEGLFGQLSWAADELNAGYYRWRASWAGPFILSDGTAVPAGPGINAGTAAIQHLFSQLVPAESWRAVVDEGGFYQTYLRLFGNPFDVAIEPLVPPDLEQPPLQLPFEPGSTWSFTSGPHAGWGSGSAWAALDFAPPGDALGCVQSEEWVVAVADGLVLRADMGEVIQDLDGDGVEQTGWVILYMHIESRDRVLPGTMLHAGDRIGHPSCEGGVSSGTHVHISRRYNGEWIPADTNLPFNMDGWISAGGGVEYDGTLSRNGIVLQACACRNDENQISR